MPQTPKLSPQQKLALVEKINAGEISRQAAAKGVGVSTTTVRQWLRLYASEGAAGLTPRTQKHHLTAAQKQAAVADALAGGSLAQVCQKYGIRNTQNLEKMVAKARQGGELRGYHGASRHRGAAYTTAADREKIVLECLANGCDYGAAAQKYAVGYHQVYRWVQRYLKDGWLGMNDRRGPAEPAGDDAWVRLALHTEADAKAWVAAQPGVPEALPELLRRAGYSWRMAARAVFDLECLPPRGKVARSAG